MKRKMTAIIMTLVLAALCCVTAQAEVKDEILFAGIAWGADLDTVQNALLDSGWINENGAERFGMIRERIARIRKGQGGGGTRYPQFVQEDGHYVINGEAGTRSAADVPLMHSMIAKDWMGAEIHNIELIFALDGDTEKLVSATVSLIAGQEDIGPELEKAYGTPDDTGEDGRSLFWLGGNGTAVMYERSRIFFGLMNIKVIMDSAQVRIEEPEKTPVPEIQGTDLLDYVRGGSHTFLGIPWDVDPETVTAAMAAQELVQEKDVRGRLWSLKAYYPQAYTDQGDHWKRLFPESFNWECYYLWNHSIDFGKTCGGYPIESVTISFKKEGDEVRFKSADIGISGFETGDEARAKLKEQLNAICGEGTDWYGSCYWSGENGTMIGISGLENTCSISFAINVPEE